MKSVRLMDPNRPLLKVPNGIYPCRKWFQFWKKKGWIVVTHFSDGQTVASWSNTKRMVDSPKRPSLAVILCGLGIVAAYFRRDENLWPVWGYGIGGPRQKTDGVNLAAFMDEVLSEYVPEQELIERLP